MTTTSTRSAAIQALAEKWPDEATRALLEQRAVQDDARVSRSAAIEALAEKWPDEATRALLAQRAVQDDSELPAAPRFRRWPRSGPTRRLALLAQRAVQDDNELTRSAALQALAEKWPDEATRTLLEQRAVRMATTSPQRRDFRRWPRSGRTRRPAPCSTAGRPG